MVGSVPAVPRLRRRPSHPPLLAAPLAVALLRGACASDDEVPAATDGVESSTTAAQEGEEPGAGAALERYADHRSEHYEDPERWVCRPDTEDICDGDLDTTVIEPDGTTTVEEFTPAEDPAVDCFYVYPTISQDTTSYSDWEPAEGEEGYVTLQQAARLGEVCRVFAPVYRQRTLTSLGEELAGIERRDEEGDPFADVLDAFRTYMANDNGGRGVVLIGHSQGSGLLTQLLVEEVDPHEDVRELLVGAYLAGSSVSVPEGELVGGDLLHVPLCSQPGEAGCVTTWSTYRATEPPGAGAIFGHSSGPGRIAGCVNPAAVGGGSAELQAYFPSNAEASILSSLGTDTEGREWLEGVEIETPFVAVPGLVSGECVLRDGVSYLEATVHDDPEGPRADDIAGDISPQWGLHLVDVSLVMGDIVDRVAEQAATHAG